LPRFTVLTDQNLDDLKKFFASAGRGGDARPGAGRSCFCRHEPARLALRLFAVSGSRFEKRGEVIRIVQTLRGGDRPKNAHTESATSPSCRAPVGAVGAFPQAVTKAGSGQSSQMKTGGLRRISDDEPFKDLIYSSPARGGERKSRRILRLKPQQFLRQIVACRAAFGRWPQSWIHSWVRVSTIAAASACGLSSIIFTVWR